MQGNKNNPISFSNSKQNAPFQQNPQKQCSLIYSDGYDIDGPAPKEKKQSQKQLDIEKYSTEKCYLDNTQERNNGTEFRILINRKPLPQDDPNKKKEQSGFNYLESVLQTLNLQNKKGNINQKKHLFQNKNGNQQDKKLEPANKILCSIPKDKKIEQFLHFEQKRPTENDQSRQNETEGIQEAQMSSSIVRKVQIGREFNNVTSMKSGLGDNLNKKDEKPDIQQVITIYVPQNLNNQSIILKSSSQSDNSSQQKTSSNKIQQSIIESSLQEGQNIIPVQPKYSGKYLSPNIINPNLYPQKKGQPDNHKKETDLMTFGPPQLPKQKQEKLQPKQQMSLVPFLRKVRKVNCIYPNLNHPKFNFQQQSNFCHTIAELFEEALKFLESIAQKIFVRMKQPKFFPQHFKNVKQFVNCNWQCERLQQRDVIYKSLRPQNNFHRNLLNEQRIRKCFKSYSEFIQIYKVRKIDLKTQDGLKEYFQMRKKFWNLEIYLKIISEDLYQVYPNNDYPQFYYYYLDVLKSPPLKMGEEENKIKKYLNVHQEVEKYKKFKQPLSSSQVGEHVMQKITKELQIQ